MRNLSLATAQNFAKVVVEDKTAAKDSTVYGTAVKFNGKMYVRLDGSERMTPVETTTSIKEGDRVTVLIKAHSATVTGNVSDPSSSTSDKKATDKKVADLSSQVTEFGTVVAGKVSTDQLQAAEARIDELEADNATINGTLKANKADITSLKADKANVSDLNATNAVIDDIKAKMITADTFDAKYATIGSLEATDAKVNNLSSNYADFKDATIDKLNAQTASIEDLEANKLSATDIEGKYANIDFSNIGVAAIKQFYATSGIIKDLVIGDQTVTGELVGVTIKGDLIEGNTIVADKLVMKGEDGLYYKLNVNAADGVTTEQTAYNSINGSIITANTITAEKIAVHDLVAFDATIAGFKIKDTAIYSTGKESAISGTRGIYLGKDGQIGFGDSANYIKFYVDTDGKYKLGISADSLTFSTGQSVKGAIDDVADKISAIKSIDTVTIGYLVGDSGTNPPTGIWSAGVPVVPNGKFLWVQKITTYTDGSSDYEYSVSRTGDKGDKGDKGDQGTNGVSITGVTEYYAVSSSNTSAPADSSFNTSVPTMTTTNRYLWNYEKITYSSGNPTNTTKRVIGVYGNTGIKGDPGSNGKSIGSIVNWYLATASASGVTTSTSGWTTDVQSVSSSKKYLWNYEVIKYTDNTVASTSTPCIIGTYGDKGDKGDPGAAGKSIGSVVNYYLATASSSGVTTSTAGWTTAVQSVSLSKKYLWNYEVVKYVDGTTASTTAPCIIGSYGDTGQKGDPGSTGNGISAITEHYAVSTSNTTAPTSWTDNKVPTMSVTNKYLWNYETITYTNGTKKDTTKRVIGVYGDTGGKGDKGDKGATGATGPTGKGVKSTAVTYQAAASPTSVPTGTWQTSPQTTSASLPYMWTRTIITYTDNTTSTSYSVGCTPEGVSVGGRNLATNTNKGTTGWSWSMQAGGYTATAVSEGGVNTCKLTRNSVAQSGWSVIQYGYIGRAKWKANTTYTLSVEVKASVATAMTPGFRHSDSSNVLIQSVTAIKNITTANAWVKLAWIVKSVPTLPSGTAQNTYFTGMNSGTGVWYQFRNLKLEEGNKATDWTPAPEDQVSVGDVTNQLNTELKVTGNSIALTTGHFTINAKNMTLDSNGNAVFSGKVSAASIEGGTIKGATITGSSGEFTEGFHVKTTESNKTMEAIFSDQIWLQSSYSTETSYLQIAPNYAHLHGMYGLELSSGSFVSIYSDTGSMFKVEGTTATFSSMNVTVDGTIKATRFITNTRNSATRMYGGTVVVNAGDNACSFINNSTINSIFGVSNASNANTAVFAGNGDAKAQSSHLEGCSYVNGNWYATFSAKAVGSYRINYLVVYFG